MASGAGTDDGLTAAVSPAKKELEMRHYTRLAGSLLILTAAALVAAAAQASGPGVFALDESSVEVVEEAGVAVVRVERSHGEDGAVSVSYAATAGTAAAGLDFTAASGTLSWAGGDETARTFEVPILDDSASEGAETILLALSSPTGGATVDGQRGTGTVVILPNDGSGGGDDGGDDNGSGPGALKFDERDFYVAEGAGQAVISVERSHGESGAVSVAYRTADDTATAGADYTATSGVLSWASGDESRKTFSVAVRADERGEASEDVVLVLSDPTGGATVDAERGTARLRIQDDDAGAPAGGDDGPGHIRFDETSFVGTEGGSGLFRVERSHGEAGTVSVRYSTADGSARAGSDYTAVSGTLTWGPGDGSAKTVSVPLRLDGEREGGETVELRLSQPTGGAAIDALRGTATLQVMDIDGQRVPCEDNGTDLCLVGGRFKVEVRWRTPDGQLGLGHGARLTDNSGTYWFFGDSNVEVLLKVLDACSVNNRFWVFFAGTTNVGFNVEVTDTRTGVTREYSNPLGLAAPAVTDTQSFSTCN
jgi:ribosomal protein L35AE/L33A